MSKCVRIVGLEIGFAGGGTRAPGCQRGWLCFRGLDAVDGPEEIGFGHETAGAADAEPAAGVDEEEGAVARVFHHVGKVDVGVVEFEKLVFDGFVGAAAGRELHADEALGVEMSDHELLSFRFQV